MRAHIPRAVLVVALAAGLLALPSAQGSATVRPMKLDHLNTVQKRLLSGFASSELKTVTGASGARRSAQGARPLARAGSVLPFYLPTGAGSCGYRLGSNVNMDQDCQNVSDADLSGRGQAQNETYISEDPFRPGVLLGSSNDYRRGDGGCFGYASRDGGRRFLDVAVPFGFTRGGPRYANAARQYWTAGGDTSSAFDTRGNAYFSCQVFNRGVPTSGNPDLSSALLVLRSTANGGASYTFPARVVTEEPNLAGGDTAPFLDKQLLTVDNHVGSRFRDRVYVTWTTFASDGTAYIFASSSANYAETWSAPVLVSRTSPLCTNTFGIPTPRGTCNANQFSQPFTAPDGTLYVAWANYNNTVTGADNRNQMLLARSDDGGATFSGPVKVGDFYELPDCQTYTGHDAGRACVPDKRDNNSYFRASNYPVGVVNPRRPAELAVTFGSFINSHSREANGCVPAGTSPASGQNLYTGTRTVGACNNDILVSVSRDGGRTFTGGTTDPRNLTSVTQTGRQATTSQWFQWADYTRDGRLAVAYYDRQYGTSELTGWSDFALSGSRDVARFATRRVTSSSMPAPTQFEGEFWGDYTGLAARTGVAHPAWSDTRTPQVVTCPGTPAAGVPPRLCLMAAPNAPVANDQEAFTRALTVPTP
jgi:hypothetical protein